MSKHYKVLSPEPIHVISQWKLDFIEGNIIKYVARYKYKNGLEDLKKAKEYLEFLIEREEAKESLPDSKDEDIADYNICISEEDIIRLKTSPNKIRLWDEG